MEPITLAAGLGISAIGMLTQMSAAQDQQRAQTQIINSEQKAEQARQQSMLLDADRRKREIVRQGIIARSQALTVGTSQGASFGSALPGVMGQIGGEQSFNYLGVNNAVSLGTDIFNANQGVLQGRLGEAAAGTKSALGSGLSSFGGKIGGLTSQIGSLTKGWGGTGNNADE